MSGVQSRIDDFWKKKKQQEESHETSIQPSSTAVDVRISQFWAQKFTSSLPDRLNTLQESKNRMYKNYNSRFIGEDGNYKNTYRGDTADALSAFNSSRTAYESDSKKFLDELSAYEKYLDAEQVKKIKEALADNTDLDDLYKAYQSDYDYFSQWENEEAYNYSVSKAEKQKQYSKMSDDELEKEIESLGGGGGFFDTLAKGVKKGFKSFALNNLKSDIAFSNTPDNIKKDILGDIEETKSKTTETDSYLALAQKEKTNRKLKALDSLPDDVKKLVEEYTTLDRASDTASMSRVLDSVGNALAGGGGAVSTPSNENAVRKTEIENEFKKLGVDNWAELVGYNRIRRDEELNAPIEAEIKKTATEHPALTSLGTIAMSPAKLFGAGEIIKSAVAGSDVPLNYNSPYFTGNNFVNTTRDTVMENYDWEGANTNIDWFDQIYSTAMSTGDSLLNMALTGGTNMGGVVLGATAMSDTAQEVARNGGSKEQALLTGIVAGVNEMVWENISIGNFKGMAEKGIKNLVSKKGIKTLAGNILKSVGVNASEEFNTEAANIIVDYLVNGGLSSYAQSYDAYRQGGYTESEARKKARNDMIYQTVMSGVGGAMQGLLMGGTGSALGGTLSKSQYNQQAKDMSPEEISALQKRAKELGVKDSKINVDVENVGPWGEKGRVSEKKLSNLLSAVDDAEAESTKNELVKKAKEYGIDTTQYNLKKNEGVQALASAIAETENKISTEANQLADSIYQNALKERLISLGENESSANYIAENILRKENGETLDEYRENSLKNKSAQVAYNEFRSVGENAPEWVKAAEAQIYSAEADLVKSYTRRTAETTENVQSGSSTESPAPVQNVTFSFASTKAAEDFAAQFDTPQKQEAARRLYVPALDRNIGFKSAFDAYYNAGLKGTGSFEAIDKYYTYAHSLPLYWRKNVFSAGRENKVYNPGVNAFYHKALSATQKNQLRIMDAIGKKFGISFLVFDELRADGEELNGMQLVGTNKILVSLDAEGKLYLRTAGHEVFHLIEEWNPAEAEKLSEKIIGYLKSTPDYDYSAQVQVYAKREGVDANTANGLKRIHSEMAADSMFEVFSNEKFVKDLVEKNRTLAQKLKNILQNFLKQLRNMMSSFKGSAEMNALREQTEALEEIRSSFHNALRTASTEMQNSLKNEQKNNASRTNSAENAVQTENKMSKKITADMSEIERAEILKNTKLKVVEYTGNEELNGKNVLLLKSSYNSKAYEILKSLGEKFGIFKGYTNENIELEFNYSRGSLNESVHKQGDISTDFYDFARMLYVFDDVINNAVPIEVHTDKYKGTKREDRNLKYDYVLLSAFSDENYIVPVELHIKEYNTQKIANKLYVSITLGKIKIEDNVKVQTAENVQRNNTQLSSTISIPQLISKINSEYGNFYKYIPKVLLNESQQKSKQVAEDDEDYRLKVMRGEDVSQILKDKAVQKGYDTDFSYRMDHKAPNAKYDVCITDINRAYGGDDSIYSAYAAHYYGDGRKYDYKAIESIRKVRNSPEKLITIYRAVPTNIKDTRIRNGDWVTIVKEYAEEHGFRTLDDDYRIIENKVPAKYLFTDGNSIHEFGYDNGNVNEVYKNTENNVKLIQPTYDDRNQLIPLSKRFDKSNPDIRYSRKGTASNTTKDSEYLSAVENGDMETAQRLVDEAAAKAGYTIKAYHGTPDARDTDRYGYKHDGTEFTVFDFERSFSEHIDGSGYYFTTNKKLAEFYAPEGMPHKKVYETYLKIENPYIVDAEGAEWNEIKNGEIESSKMFGYETYDKATHSWGYKYRDTFSTKQISQYAKTKDYDGVIIKNVLDGNPDDTNIGVSDVYVVFDNKKIKSADLVTYDDNGEIIPLSERFKEDKKDIRYSRKMSSSAREVLDSNPELKLIFQNMQNQMQLSEGYIPDGKRIHQFAVQLRKDTETTLPVAELESDLQEIYKVLATIEDSEGYEYAWDLTVELAQKMLTNSRVLDDLNAEKKDLRERLTKYLRGRKFYLSPSMKAEIESYYDTYGNFHRKIFGRGFSFSENATTTLESEWNDLCAELPGLFDPDTVAAEQPIALLEAFNATEWQYGLFDEYQYDSQVNYTATEIMNALTDIPTTTTLLDRITERQYNEIASLNAQNREKIKELKQQYSDEIERVSSEAEVRYRMQIKKNMEQKKATEVRRQIEKQIVRLSDMLAHGKKNRHIPLKLIDAVRDLCYAVTLNRASQTELGKNLSIIEASYAALNAGKEDADGELNNQFTKNAYDEYVYGLIQDLGKTLQHKSVANMTLAELIQVNETVKAVAQRVTRANELHIESRNAGVEETANAIGFELGAPKMKRAYSWEPLNKASDKAEFEAWKFLKPVYAWRMMGSETFGEIMGNIRAGEDTWAVDMYEAKEKIDALAEKYNKKTWEKGKIEVELSSGTYSFSIQQLMMLYVASQREQYIPHLLGNPSKESPTGRVGGGFVFEDAYRVEQKNFGKNAGDVKKVKPKMYRVRDAGTHTLIEEDLNKIADVLTAEQKGYANEMRDYLARDLAVKGNEITRVLYDMNKFVEDKYFPIKVSRKFLDGTTKEPEVRSVLSQSMLKDLQEDASDPVLLRDFDTVWAEHVQQMAMFHSFALPLDDFKRVFNFRTTKGKAISIKDQIETACGKGAISYIENFIKDVNGGVRAQNGAELVNTMVSKFKKGAVFASASVTIQQPSAIARALAEIDPKYFTNPTLTNKDYEELMKYAPIARIKSMGFFDTNIGQSSTEWLTSEKYSAKKEKLGAFFSTKDSSYRDELLSKAPEVMDEITWCNIWHAVKKEMAAKTGLTGEELLKKSGKRFAEVVELTQVYDSVFSKSELMRSRDTGVKMMTAFMAEPTVSLNMLVDAAVRVKKGDLKGGGRYVGAFVASVVLNNILKALVTAPRDDDEEKTLIEKYIAKVLGGIKGDLNPLTLVPIAKDIVSIFDGYSVERADMALVQNLYDAIKDLSSDKKTGLEKGFGFANALTAFLGIPSKNITRDLKAVGNLVSGFLTIGDTSAEGIKQAVKEDSSDSLWNKYIKKIIFGSSEEQLYSAIKSGDYSAYEKLQKGEYGGDSKKVNAAIREGLVNGDERVTLAAQARLDKDFYSYDKYVREIAKDGFSNENVVKAVNTVYNKLTEEEDEEPTEKFYSLYTSDDLNIALETGGDYKTVIEDMIEASKKNGSTQKDAESSVKSKIASYWKEVYFNASAQERKEIEKLLDETGLYRDIEETTSGWVYSILKEEYIAATSTAERNRIKQEIWKCGYFSTRSKMNDSLEKLLEDEEE